MTPDTDDQKPASQNASKTTDGAGERGTDAPTVETAPAEQLVPGPVEPEELIPPSGEVVVPAAADAEEAPAPSRPSEPDQLEEARALAQRTRDQLLRMAADFDNYRKRSRREIDDAEKRGREELLRDLLPVFDNLERAAAHAGQATEAKAVAEGVNIVLRQFLDTLGKIGILRIRAQGQPFDPMQHEAIHQVESADYPAGTVVEEVQPGYAMGDRLIRPAMVVVSKARQPRPESADQKID